MGKKIVIEFENENDAIMAMNCISEGSFHYTKRKLKALGDVAWRIRMDIKEQLVTQGVLQK